MPSITGISSITGGAALIDNYSETNYDTQISVGSNQRVGQSITGTGKKIGSVIFFVKSDAATGDVFARVYAHSGTFGTSSVGTGTALASSDAVPASSLNTSFSRVVFNFSSANQILLETGTYYVIAFERGTSTAVPDVQGDGSSPTHAGNYCLYNGSTWSASATIDVCFYLYSTSLQLTF
jgi:hypothetical protein